jgi:Flp pilus assembly protein TadD/TolB-like protein
MCALAWLSLVPGIARAQSPASAGGSRLVIPFENVTRDPRGYWLSEGSAVLMTDALAALGADTISRETRMAVFDRLNVPPVATLSHATVIRVGRVVDAAQVVLGTFALRGDEVEVRARVIQLDTGQLFPEVTATGALDEIFAVYARVAGELVPNAAPASADAPEPPPLAAFEQYIKGLLATAPETQISFLTQAIRLAPTFHRARLALWTVQTDQGAHRQALDVVRQVPAEDPAARLARFDGAISMIYLGQYPQAFETLTGLNKTRDDPGVLNNLGIVQLRSPAGAPGNKAVWYFAEAARLNPRDPDLFFNLGYASWLAKDTYGAIGALRETVRRNPADEEAHRLLAVALQAGGNRAEAARELTLAMQLSSDAPEWRNRAGVVEVPSGLERFKNALDASDSLSIDDVIVATGQQDQRQLAGFHLAAGRRLLEAERDVEAISELRRAIYLAPYDSDALRLLGQAYLHTGRPDDAIDALKISIWSRNSTAAHMTLAEAYIQAGDDDEARTELEALVKADPNNREARELLASLATP